MGDAQASNDCRTAADGGVRKRLQVVGCSRVIRATFSAPDGKYFVTGGIFNLPDAVTAGQFSTDVKNLIADHQGRFTWYVSDPEHNVVLGRSPLNQAWLLRLFRFKPACVPFALADSPSERRFGTLHRTIRGIHRYDGEAESAMHYYGPRISAVRRIVSTFVSVVVALALGSCDMTPLAPTYGQMLPDAFCDAFDFDPIIAAIDVGQPTGGPIFNRSGIENRWYSCSVMTQRRDGPDRYRFAEVWIKVELFGQLDSATKAFEDAVAELRAPVDFRADSVQQAVKDVRAYGYFILILDRNLVIRVGAVDGDGNYIAPAAEKFVDELSRAALEEVRRSSTSA